MEPFETLSLCAEIAIAITGFSGVVVALGGRDGIEWSAGDAVRFRLLLSATLVPLSLIALAFILDASDFDRIAIWRACSAGHVIAVSLSAFFNLRAGARADSGDPNLQIPHFHNIWRGGSIALVGVVLVMVLQISNAVSLHSFWPFLVAIWWGIGLSLFAFIGLLFPPQAE